MNEVFSILSFEENRFRKLHDRHFLIPEDATFPNNRMACIHKNKMKQKVNYPLLLLSDAMDSLTRKETKYDGVWRIPHSWPFHNLAQSLYCRGIQNKKSWRKDPMIKGKRITRFDYNL